MDEIDHLSSWSGKRPAVITFYTNWCPDQIDTVFNIQMNNIWNDTTIPLITESLENEERKKNNLRDRYSIFLFKNMFMMSKNHL
jgi:thiol-disulfide isomerase/thioredoxin